VLHSVLRYVRPLGLWYWVCLGACTLNCTWRGPTVGALNAWGPWCLWVAVVQEEGEAALQSAHCSQGRQVTAHAPQPQGSPLHATPPGCWPSFS